MFKSRRDILWLDCIGGLVVGVAVLAFFRPISSWEGLPTTVVVGMGVANLVYGSYSLFVTTRQSRSRALVQLLAIANMAWLAVCLLIAFFYWAQVTPIGILHVIGEGVYVACLGFVEWIWRNELGE